MSGTRGLNNSHLTDVEGPMCAPTDGGASFVPRGPVKDGYIVYVITRYSSLLSVTGVGHVDVV
ncbi:hypothetical protein INS49_006048 [Diaporthe citri]|uniref:uncharacterized protein n=1 Tax=Diaporthe citri TaxID=83186 RepID=UPI001C826139|nr:uncharacterized protein INS49_006048 [Diaporthe citri]KAG6364447.1 hypothetical protein INS49_006048 [Diaporthe citri]